MLYQDEIDEDEKLRSEIQEFTQKYGRIRNKMSLTEERLQSNNEKTNNITKTLYENKSIEKNQSQLMFTYQQRVGDYLEKNRTSISANKFQAVTEANDDFETPDNFQNLLNLIKQLRTEKHYKLAVSICKLILEDLIQNKGHDSADVTAVLNILGLIYRDQKFEKGIAVAAASSNLAVSYANQGKLSLAKTLCERSLGVLEEKCAEDDPMVAKQLHNAAQICFNQKDYTKAETYYLRLLKIYTNKFGNSHSLVQKVLNDLGRNYIMQSKFKEARAISKQIAILIKNKINNQEKNYDDSEN